jgi:hypothetical protein
MSTEPVAAKHLTQSPEFGHKRIALRQQETAAS